MRLWLLVCCVALVPGCALIDSISGDGDGDGDGDGGPDPLPPAEGTFQINRQVDLLFVVDNSGSMFEEQTNLAASFPTFVNALQNIAGGMPDLHLGVVSTNTGATGGIAQCGVEGDDGLLQFAPTVGGCSGPDEAFIRDIQEGDARLTNYSGTLGDTFSCIAQLGTNGCGFESPLDAARRAIAPGHNPGFIRDSALLAVVFLTDEDDCSVSDRATFFGGLNQDVNDPLGPFSSFRCFDFGIRCDPDEPRTFGDKSGCVPREDSPFLDSVTELAQTFRDRKGKGRVVTTAIIGQPELSVESIGFDATVIPNPFGGQLAGTPHVDAVCNNGAGDAVPAIRLQAFLDEFPNSINQSICSAQFALAPIGDQIADALAITCMPDGTSAPEFCIALRSAPSGEGREITPCVGGETDCFEFLDVEPACDGGAALRYRPAVGEIPGTVVDFDCFTPQ